jgi:transcriptional regulator of acetoin/glycerol metabolism
LGYKEEPAPMPPSSTASDLRVRASGATSAIDYLFVVMSCASPLEAPSRHALSGVDEVRIGRGGARKVSRREEGATHCLQLTLSDPHVSTVHARLVRSSGRWILEDLASKNGTVVNGAVTVGSPLVDGDCIQVGHTLLILRTLLPAPAHIAADQTAVGRVPALATLVPSLVGELDTLARVALSDVPVLLVSETGTGKDLLAQAVHSLSRRTGAFVAVNCGGLPATLVESVLFGHARGAFSGAVADHPGLIRSANRGTLLLDEIGDMSSAAQAAVLRTLQDGEVLGVGEVRATRVDARIVAATHRSLESLVEAGLFREDLLARLSGFTFRLPALRERREDIGLLTAAILRRVPANDGQTSFSPEAGLALLRYSWPQNVRELEKCLRRAVAVSGQDHIQLEHLPESVRHGPRPRGARSAEEDLRAHVVALLDRNQGNISMAAMRTSRSQVHRWLKRLAIDPAEFRR